MIKKGVREKKDVKVWNVKRNGIFGRIIGC